MRMIGSAQDKADRTEIRFYYRSVPHFYSYDYTNNPYVPVISFGSYDPNNPNNYLDRVIRRRSHQQRRQEKHHVKVQSGV